MHPIELPAAAAIALSLEALMLLCFGLAWPVNSLAMLRSRRPEGKGLTFTTIVWCGYLFGATAKLVLAFGAGTALAPVFWLYVLNSLTVAINAGLYCHFRRHVVAAKPGPSLVAPVEPLSLRLARQRAALAIVHRRL